MRITVERSRRTKAHTGVRPFTKEQGMFKTWKSRSSAIHRGALFSRRHPFGSAAWRATQPAAVMLRGVATIVYGKLFFFEPLDVTHSDTIRAFGFLFVKAIPRPHRSLPPRVLVSALAPVLLLSPRTAAPALDVPGVESSKACAVRSLLLAIEIYEARERLEDGVGQCS